MPTAIDLTHKVIDGSIVEYYAGTDRTGAVVRRRWVVRCVCSRQFFATREQIRKAEKKERRHRLRCKNCKGQKHAQV